MNLKRSLAILAVLFSLSGCQSIGVSGWLGGSGTKVASGAVRAVNERHTLAHPQCGDVCYPFTFTSSSFFFTSFSRTPS